MPIPVWILGILSDTGTALTLHPTAEEANAALVAYVDREWPYTILGKRPDDAAQRVRDYFAYADGDEDYWLEHHEFAPPQPVWVACISNDHGVIVSAHASEAGAMDVVRSYVEDNWSDELPHEPKPTDVDTLIGTYFAEIDRERYWIEKTTLQP